MRNNGALLLIIAMMIPALMVSGCATEEKLPETLYGRDVFEPLDFSMARYDLTINDSGDVSHRPFIVTSAIEDEDGDRLTSVEIMGESSTKADVWIGRQREKTLKVIMTDIRRTLMRTGEVSLSFNVTTMDRAWNTLSDEYKLVGTMDVKTPAGDFKGCSVYGASKTMTYGGEQSQVNVFYVMHPSVPVPVKYEVNGASSSETYELQSYYGRKDKDSSPERAIQSYFEYLDAGEFDRAADMLVKKDGGQYKPLDVESRGQMRENMGNSYGKNGEKVSMQYVLVEKVSPELSTGADIIEAHWVSVQYSSEPIKVYNIDGNFNMIRIKGKWYLIA
jgi:hypothetical protein